MSWLTKALQQYFDGAIHGLPELMPECRVQNRGFLCGVLQALQPEVNLTLTDIRHLETLIQLADSATIPALKTPRDLIDCEVYLFRACPRLSKKDIRFCMRYIFRLLSRHGLTGTKSEQIDKWPDIWRIVRKFEPLEQTVIVDYIDWLERQGFSCRSVYDAILELYRLYQWMRRRKIKALEAFNDFKLQVYLSQRAKGQQETSKQRILSCIRPFMHYYKNAINGGYQIPTFIIHPRHAEGVNQSANSDEVSLLWEAIIDGQLSHKASLLLVLIMGYGLHLKILPLLRLTDEPGKLAYRLVKSSRQGEVDRHLMLDLSEDWLSSIWETFLKDRADLKAYPYLFFTQLSIKNHKPVSVDYCQRLVQEAVKSILGYPISVNHLERGSLRAMAAQNLGIDNFMAKTEDIPLTKRTRLMYWLAHH
jgi:site-specific recombinase XerD